VRFCLDFVSLTGWLIDESSKIWETEGPFQPFLKAQYAYYGSKETKRFNRIGP
jgi:hypothetical protein